MADLKIVVSADPTNALNNLEKTRDSIKATGRTIGEVLNSSARAFRNFSEAESRSADDTTDAGKAINNYNDKLKLIKDSYTHAIASANDYKTKMSLLRKELALFSKEYQEALLQGKFTQGSNKDGLANQLEADMDEVRKEIKLLEAEKAKTTDTNNEIKRKAEAEQLQLIGTEYEKLTAEIDKHKASLRALLIQKQKEGKASDELKHKIDREVQAIKELTKEQQKASKVGFFEKMLSIAKNIMGFQMAIMLFRKTTTAIVNTMKESVKAAAEAEQVYSKLTTVFDGVATSMESMRKTASQLGVANSTAASALSTVGDLLQAQGMGATESLQTAAKWAKQFQDIIAFKDVNMSLEEFAQNFMSGAAGNLRNFRTFGSVVKEANVQVELAKKGLDKLTGSQLELAKMTTRAEMALEQQANAMGATEREWDTALSVSRRLTEAWKQFKITLGETLLGSVIPLKREITEILDRINDAAKKKKGERVYGESVNTKGSDDYNALVRDIRWTVDTSNEDALRQDLEKMFSHYDVLPSENIFKKAMKEAFPVDTDIWNMNLGKMEDAFVHLENIRAIREKEDEAKRLADAFAIANDNLAILEGSLEEISGIGSIYDTRIWGDVGSQEELDALNAQAKNVILDSAGYKALNLDYKDFYDDILGSVDEVKATQDAYTKLAESIFSVYSILKTNNADSALLKNLVDYYKQITEEGSLVVQNLTDIEKAPDTFKKALESMQSSTNDWYVKAYDAKMGFSDRNKALVEADTEYVKTLNTITNLTEAQKTQLEAELKAQKESIKAYYDSKEAEEKKQKAAEELEEAQKELADALKDMHKTMRDDIFGTFGSIGSLGQALYRSLDMENLEKSFKELFSDLWKGLKTAFGAKDEFVSAEQVTKVRDLWSAILAVLDELDVFKAIVELLNAPLNAINSILAPFLPVIEMLGEQLHTLMQIFSPLIPVMKVFASVITVLATSLTVALNMILAVFGDVAGGIVDFVGFIVKALDKIFGFIRLPFFNISWGWAGIIPYPKFSIEWKSLSDMMGLGKIASGLSDASSYLHDLGSYNATDAFDQMNETLDKIWATSNEIATNTEKDDLSDVLAELNELYANGIIDANTYNARVNKLTGTRSLDMVNSRGIWNNGFSAGVRNNYMNVTINGSGLSASELESTLINVLTKITNGTVSVQTQLGSFA